MNYNVLRNYKNKEPKRKQQRKVNQTYYKANTHNRTYTSTFNNRSNTNNGSNSNTYGNATQRYKNNTYASKRKHGQPHRNLTNSRSRMSAHAPIKTKQTNNIPANRNDSNKHTHNRNSQQTQSEKDNAHVQHHTNQSALVHANKEKQCFVLNGMVQSAVPSERHKIAYVSQN